jgi:hypothetical protein
MGSVCPVLLNGNKTNFNKTELESVYEEERERNAKKKQKAENRNAAVTFGCELSNFLCELSFLLFQLSYLFFNFSLGSAHFSSTLFDEDLK